MIPCLLISHAYFAKEDPYPFHLQRGKTHAQMIPVLVGYSKTVSTL